MRSPPGATLLSSALSHCSITRYCFSSSASSTGHVKTFPLINEDNNAYFNCLYYIMKFSHTLTSELSKFLSFTLLE